MSPPKINNLTKTIEVPLSINILKPSGYFKYQLV
jgi:hypothetical protein